MVQGQIQDTLLRRRHCPECGKTRHSKGHHDNTIRTLFGNIELQSSRLEHCRCQVHVEKTHGAAVAHRLEDSKYLPSFGVAFTRVALEAYSAAGGPPLGLDGVGWFHSRLWRANAITGNYLTNEKEGRILRDMCAGRVVAVNGNEMAFWFRLCGPP